MAVPVEIELARLADAEWMAELSRIRVESGLAWRWTPAAIRRQIRSTTTEAIVARYRGRPAGFALLHYDDDEAHLLLFAVDAALLRRGIGARLLAWLDAEARTAGIAAIHLEVRASNRVARAFYQVHGYREAGYLPGYYQGVEDAVHMVARLRVTAH